METKRPAAREWLHRATLLAVLGTVAPGVLLWSVVPSAQAQTEPGQSRLALPDRRHWVEVCHELEAAPLDDQANRDAEMALQEIKQDVEFHMELGPAFFSFVRDLNSSGYPYQAQMVRLYMLGSSAYLVETGRNDTNASSVAALTSVVKGYNAVLQKQPTARTKVLDTLLIADIKGKLPEYVAKAH